MTTDKSIGFVGAGRVARILLEGLQRQSALPAKITVYDANPEATKALKAIVPTLEIAAASATAAAQDIVFLAVHPPAMVEMAAGIKGQLKPEGVAVSLAPKFTIAKLGELLGGFNRLARCIPNAPSLIGAGYNPMTFAPALGTADKADLTELLQPLGDCPEVDEAKLEAYAILSAMGPTYLWFQLQTLREVAADLGLTDADITPALKRTVCGATRTLLESELTPAEVINLIPVKPLAEMEAPVAEMYRTRLPGLYQRIKP
ncbi:MAG: NAD(P)-binding domain-containing protein [Verrucomicrobiales bacterium]|nr:NAD(P)-binding domain-containing protein [Verrucomicrobiales bacterium]